MRNHFTLVSIVSRNSKSSEFQKTTATSVRLKLKRKINSNLPQASSEGIPCREIFASEKLSKIF